MGATLPFPGGNLEMCRGILGCRNDGVTSLDAKYPTLWMLVLIDAELHSSQN